MATVGLLGRSLARLPAATTRCRATSPAAWDATWTDTARRRPTSPRSRRRSTVLLAGTDGQILTSLPGVAVTRAAAFAAHSLPIARFHDAEHLYSATGLAPAMYQSATLHRRGRISRQGLAEHRDALMGIAWGCRSTRRPSPSATPRPRPRHGPDPGPSRARPPRLPPDLPAPATPNNPSTNSVSSRKAQPRTVTATLAMPHTPVRRRNLACRPPALGRLTAHTKACRSTAPDQPAEPRRPTPRAVLDDQPFIVHRNRMPQGMPGQPHTPAPQPLTRDVKASAKPIHPQHADATLP